MDDNGIRRSGRAGTDDLEAQPTDGVSESGSGVQGGGSDTGHPTADPSALGDAVVAGEGWPSGTPEDAIDDLSTTDAADRNLGLTNIGNVPADDWAADTGPTQTGETAAHGVSRELVDEEVAADGQRIEFDRDCDTASRRQ